MTTQTEERRLLTILFADLSGFTALSAKLDPEVVREAVNISFEHLNKPIVEEAGTIIKYEGDLVMAVFGQPAAHEDDPERAVRAALGMFQRLPQVNSELASRLRIEGRLGLHIGINSGTVVVGEIGSEEKREYTVMGEAVNLASRLKDAAQTGEILVSEPVFRATRYLFEYQPKTKISAKGFDRPIAVFQPLKLRDKPEPKRGIAGLTSPMVGRDRELALLCEDVRTLARGRGGATFVVGEAGLGKSRLLAELKAVISGQGINVKLLEGRCLSYGQNVPYWPVLQALEAALGVDDRDPSEAVLDKIVRRCRELMPGSWIDSAPYLAHLFSLELPEEMSEKVAHLDAKALKATTHLALKKFLTALAGQTPVLLVVDDFHWADEATDEFLLELCGTPAAPIWLLVLARPERDAGGQQSRERFRGRLGLNYREISLSPLDQDSGTSLAFNLLNVPGIGQGFKDMLLAKSGGNPFYLEEIIRSLIDSGVLAYRQGVWRLTKDVSSINVPDTVQMVIAARLDRLERELRDILQTASVLGRSFHVRLLEALSGLDDMMLTLYLATLEEFDFIAETQKGPEPEYSFRHPLSQEVAYQALLKKRRRELHRLAGQAIERTYASRLEDFAEILAHHYANSDDEAKAIEWLGRAGRKTRDRFANQEAIFFFTSLAEILKWLPERERELCQACSILGELHDLVADLDESMSWFKRMEQHAGEDKVLRARARRMQAEILQKQGKFDEAMDMLQRSETELAAKQPGELKEQAEIHILRCWILRIKGDIDEAVRQGETALRILETDLMMAAEDEQTGLAKSKVQLLNNLGGVFFTQGEIDRAIRLFEKCAAICTEQDLKRPRGAALCNLGIMHYSKGDLAKALDYYRSFQELSQRIGDKKGLGAVYGNMAIVYNDLGEYDRALDLHQKALEIDQEVGDRMAVALNFGNLGLVYKARGDYAKAVELFNNYQETAREIGNKQGMAIAGLNIANVRQLEGKHDQAEAIFREIEPLFSEIGDKASLCELYTGWADLKVEGKKDLAEADRLAAKARSLGEEIGSETRLGDVEWTFANLRSAEGDYQTSEEHFRRALEIFEKSGQKRSQADVCLAYAKMLGESGRDSDGRAEKLKDRARAIYQELGLDHKAADCS
jgi:class 3 adenylate cyclase/tetratricopeptide (TPR) repeat protein